MSKTGMSDADLIRFASKFYESKYAVPEKTTWDYVQEDLSEWQTASKARAAKFMEDLPEEFDLNKIEPQGRDAVSKWFKDMRSEYMLAANNTSIWDPASNAYAEGASKMNKIEDSMDAVSAIFDNMKEIRKNSIENESNWASRVPEDKKGLMRAVISGEVFENMKIETDGTVTFTVDGQEYDSEDIKDLPVKAYKSESAYNAVLGYGEELRQNGLDWKSNIAGVRSKLAKALNDGKKTGENMDMMFDVSNGDLKDPKSYITLKLEEEGLVIGTKEYKDRLKEIKTNIEDFYNENEDDFIDNFLMVNVKNTYDKSKMTDENYAKLEEMYLKNQELQAKINKVNSETNNSVTNTANLEEQGKQVNSILAENPENATFKYGIFTVDKKGGTFSINDGKKTKIVNSEEEMMNLINFNDGGSGDARRELRKKQNQVPVVPRSITANTGGASKKILSQLDSLYGPYDVKFSREGSNLKITGPDKKTIIVEMNRYGDENNNESRTMIRNFILNYVK